MEPGEIIEILTTGIKSAHGRMFRKEHIKAKDTLQISKLYGILEDEVHSLYLRIEHGDYKGIIDEAGDVIAYASMIIELAEGRKEILAKGRNST